MKKSSFSFNGHNSMEEWGIFCTAHDFLMPPKRERKQQIPGRSGRYDYGARTFDERTLRLDCKMIQKNSRAQLREISYLLSQKGKIILWDDPEKYYIGELYDPQDFTEIAGGEIREFELNFICEPFAYREATTQAIREGTNPLHYGGTAETPCVIQLNNPNGFQVSNITITVVKKSN